MSLSVSLALVLAAVAVLWKSADWFVEGAVGIATHLKVPPMLVGLVLVSLATTAPELMVSLLAALQGSPEMALGNAVGSVIVDDAVALGLAALVAPVPLLVEPRIFKPAAIFLIVVDILAFALVWNGTLAPWEGGLLVLLFAAYTVFAYVRERRFRTSLSAPDLAIPGTEAQVEAAAHLTTRRAVLLFVVGLAGVLLGSDLLVRGATGIAEILGWSKALIGLTITAIGTSMPEVATAVTSAARRQGDVGVGNIIGADILNVCWVAGLSALASPGGLSVTRQEVLVMFPAMLVVVGLTLGLLRMGYRLQRWKGAILVASYVVYAVILWNVMRGGAG